MHFAHSDSFCQISRYQLNKAGTETGVWCAYLGPAGIREDEIWEEKGDSDGLDCRGRGVPEAD